MKRAYVVLGDDHISALNYWGVRKTIPLHDIKELGDFDSNGIRATTVISGNHSTVYISDITIGIDDLLKSLKDQISRNEHWK